MTTMKVNHEIYFLIIFFSLISSSLFGSEAEVAKTFSKVAPYIYNSDFIAIAHTQ